MGLFSWLKSLPVVGHGEAPRAIHVPENLSRRRILQVAAIAPLLPWTEILTEAAKPRIYGMPALEPYQLFVADEMGVHFFDLSAEAKPIYPVVTPFRHFQFGSGTLIRTSSNGKEIVKLGKVTDFQLSLNGITEQFRTPGIGPISIDELTDDDPDWMQRDWVNVI